MSKMPDRIWAWLDVSQAAEEQGQLEGEWSNTHDPDNRYDAVEVPYIRESNLEAIEMNAAWKGYRLALQEADRGIVTRDPRVILGKIGNIK